jgi:hypothetical protein
VLLVLPPQSMMEQDWTPSKVMKEHLQNLKSQGFMMAMELVTCRVPEDPVSPTLVEGYVVSFVAFYERGFGVSPHRFLCSMLQHYHLELQNMTPLGILHIATFMTLWEAYMGLTLTLTMCGNRCLQDPNLEITILGGCGYPCQVRARCRSLF